MAFGPQVEHFSTAPCGHLFALGALATPWGATMESKPDVQAILDNLPPFLLTIRQCATYLGVSESTVWRLIDDGELPTVTIRKRAVRIRPSDLEKLAVAS